MPATIKFIAFDLDGVLADTEPIHKKIKHRILEELGYGDRFDLNACVGRPNHELWGNAIEQCGLSLTIQELEQRQYDYILEYMHEHGVTTIPGFVELLDFLSSRNIRYGICSSSNRYYVDRILALFNLTSRMAVIVGGDDVAHKKPAPDGYRKIAKDSGFATEEIVAVEDSHAGITAAVAAGLRCIAYLNPSSGNQDFSQAFLQVHELSHIADWLQQHA